MCLMCQLTTPQFHNYAAGASAPSASFAWIAAARAASDPDWTNINQQPDNPYGKSEDYEGFLGYLGALSRPLTKAQAAQPIRINVSELNNHPEYKAAAIGALQQWSAVTPLRFEIVDNRPYNSSLDYMQVVSPEVGETDEGSAYSSGRYVSVGQKFHDTEADTTPGGYIFDTFLHEFGHEFGLNHPGLYNYGGSTGLQINYLNNATWAYDRQQYSIMSYFDGIDVGEETSWAASTPMIGDIEAVIRRFFSTVTNGVRTYQDIQLNTGNDVYGFNSGKLGYTLTATGLTHDIGFVIHDTGGNDTIDFSNSTAGTILDLRAGRFSSVNGHSNNVAIFAGHNADGTQYYIEKGVGSAYDDTILGNDGANELIGGRGDDRIAGFTGDDKLIGGAGADTLVGGAGGDIFIIGSTLNATNVDIIEDFSTSDDTIHLDSAVFTALANGALAAGAFIANSTGEATTAEQRIVYETDTGKLYYDADGSGTGTSVHFATLGAGLAITAADFAVIFGSPVGNEPPVIVGPDPLVIPSFDTTLTGTDTANTLTGTAGKNLIDGKGGNDTLNGAGGNDEIFGGTGNDLIIGGRDSLASRDINNTIPFANLSDKTESDDGSDLLHGGDGNDDISGGQGDDVLYGDAGDDVLRGQAGVDIFIGGDGIDTVDFSKESPFQLLVNLETNVANGGTASGDTFYSIENLIGSNDRIDRFIGNDANNHFIGQGGGDNFNGGGGNDILDGGKDGDILYGDAGDDILIGGAGQDALHGGDGVDTAVFSGSTAAVTINLATGVNSGGDAQGSTTRVGQGTSTRGEFLTGIENVIGSNYADRLTGDAGANRLTGGSGNDTLTGGAGIDTFVFDKALSRTSNLDRITDFSALDDTILLDNAIFTAFADGALAASAFVANTSGTASNASHRIIYETDTGNLFYDSNGNAGGGSTQFATLAAGLTLTAADFVVI